MRIVSGIAFEAKRIDCQKPFPHLNRASIKRHYYWHVDGASISFQKFNVIYIKNVAQIQQRDRRWYRPKRYWGYEKSTYRNKMENKSDARKGKIQLGTIRSETLGPVRIIHYLVTCFSCRQFAAVRQMRWPSWSMRGRLRGLDCGSIPFYTIDLKWKFDFGDLWHRYPGAFGHQYLVKIRKFI